MFPASRGLYKSSAFHNKIAEAFTSGNTSHGAVNPEDTYSIQIFSTESENPLLEYHQCGPATLGDREIDGDSIHHIASVSKLLTVQLLLLEAGENIFNEKVITYLPGLEAASYWKISLSGHLLDILGT